MAKKRENITPENINEWLGSLGFLFPRNKLELARFEKLYAEYDYELSGNIIDPEKIIKGEIEQIVPKNTSGESEEVRSWRMAARNFSDIPDRILQKMKKNQGNEDSDGEEKIY